WVCSDRVQYSALPPGLPDRRPADDTDAFPYRYFYVSQDGAQAYAKPADVEDGSPVEELERGWAVATTGETTWNGRTFERTKKGRFIERSQLAPIALFSFHGEALHVAAGASPSVAWVFPDKATVLASASAAAKVTGKRTRLQKVDALATKKVGRDMFMRVTGDDAHGEWMRAGDLRAPTTAPMPEGLRAGERWIDVELATQTLTAYEGDRPVFATVVSTGRVAGTTPKGAFRIWVKLRTATMANADDPGLDADAPLYSIEDVPYVQYFSNGVALHAAFWHRRFGEPHSHGCVNLAPLDALWLFKWTTPRLPAGWDATFPTDAEPATLVRVR
ncbi:MAG: L,D-transpeptidase, partial [Polyangiales bacterium]